MINKILFFVWLLFTIFLLYKLSIENVNIIRINYFSLLLLSIFNLVFYYQQYFSIVVEITKVDNDTIYYENNSIKTSDSYKVCNTVVLYKSLFGKEYVLYKKSTQKMLVFINFSLIIISALLLIYTRQKYPDLFKSSSL
jgi:hypothetical protein